MSREVYSQLAEGFELLAAGYRSLAEQGAEATSTAAPEPKKPITIEQVRAVMSAKSDEGKTAQVKALLMKYECIDPRFKYVARGCAEVVEWLGQTLASCLASSRRTTLTSSEKWRRSDAFHSCEIFPFGSEPPLALPSLPDAGGTVPG